MIINGKARQWWKNYLVVVSEIPEKHELLTKPQHQFIHAFAARTPWQSNMLRRHSCWYRSHFLGRAVFLLLRRGCILQQLLWHSTRKKRVSRKTSLFRPNQSPHPFLESLVLLKPLLEVVALDEALTFCHTTENKKTVMIIKAKSIMNRRMEFIWDS